MDKEFYEQRIKELSKAIDDATVHHHLLVGRLQEANYFLDQENNKAQEEAPQPEQPVQEQPDVQVEAEKVAE